MEREGQVEPAQQVWIVMTTLPDEASARQMTAALLEAGLAACVNRLAPCESEYRWQGAIEQAREWPLLIKTTSARYAALEAAIRSAHPYEVPEIVAWPLAGGFAPYLAWVRAETAPAGQQ